ncbi:MAG TPA: thiamine phosphate synthase [Polyangia bacterium]|nr:thiamine phosphate synthase [Polyangia bacterium]
MIRGLYGMIDLPATADAATGTALAGALVDGGACIVQLRMKGADAADLVAIARALSPWCRARGVAFVVNDRLDVALAAGADGVHLGQDDLPLAAARSVAPAGFVVGVSTHDEAQARAAVAGAASYIGFGPCFTTSTKRNPDPVVGLARLARVCGASSIPVVAIGGITLDTVADVARAGAAAAAVIRAVNSAPDVAAAARAVTAAFDRSRAR